MMNSEAKKKYIGCLFPFLFITMIHLYSQSINGGKIYIDANDSSFPLAGIDALGRALPQYDQVGAPKANKEVAMFYFLWHGDKTSKTSARYWDLSKIVSNHPEVLNDFDNQYWGGGGMYYWGEPVYGYYRADDYWVQLKNVQLLTDANVDILVIDATNTFVYPKSANVLMDAMDAVRAQGKSPPKIVFYTNTSSGATMQKAYDKFFSMEASYRHPGCWYYLNGKPLIIGQSKEAKGKNYENFFTYRESQWPNEPQKKNGWPWISFSRSQKVYYNRQDEKEIINVSVAQHPNWKIGMGGSAFYDNTDNWGRSYHDGSAGSPSTDMVFGYNFQEQWDFAIKQNTPFIFVTGWNEWIAGRFKSHDGNPEHSWFCDEASPEFSRDIEPTRTANLKDNYYIQLISNIRRYKGIKRNPTAGSFKTTITFDDWATVKNFYKDYTGDIRDRDHRGAQLKPKVTYTNYTGQNDFQILKAARDKVAVYFYARTVDPITSTSGKNWMVLYLNTDRKANTGWQGYNFKVIKGQILQQYSNGKWKNIHHLEYKISENEMMITLPREYIDQAAGHINLAFKWSDNMQNEKDPLDWYINGDAAPGGRFNIIYMGQD